jgi:hypothetical protein
MVLPPRAAWARLQDMQQVVLHQPVIAHAVRCLPLCDQLELTLELLQQDNWPEFAEPELLPPNVVRFRPTCTTLRMLFVKRPRSPWTSPALSRQSDRHACLSD